MRRLLFKILRRLLPRLVLVTGRLARSLAAGSGGRAVRRTRAGRAFVFRADVAALFVVPGRLVVSHPPGVEAGEQAVFGQLESVFDDEGGVGVVDEVISGEAIILDGVVDEAAEEGYVRARAYLQEEVGGRRRAREPRVNDDHLRVAVELRLNRPLEAARGGLGSGAAHGQNHVRVLDVDPAVFHRAASECGSQT